VRRLLGAGLVAIQAVLLFAFFMAEPGDDWDVPWGLAGAAGALGTAGLGVLILAAVNLGRSLTALPNPAERATLKTAGLYRFVRHPLYAGLLALVLGRTVTSGSLTKAGLGAALFALILGKACWEEQMLCRRYAEYAEYAARTPRFIPLPIRRARRT
jgi:protein-S-isoprenylcysteine O-methyltransferase Ste14